MRRKLKLLLELPSATWLMFITYLPGEIGLVLRYKFWKKRLRHLGNKAIIDIGVDFYNPSYISIGDNTWIDRNVLILAGLDDSKREKIVMKNSSYKGEIGVVCVGKNCHIGVGCIISGISAGVYISDNCGIAANGKIYAFSHHYRSKREPESLIIGSPMAPDDKQCLIEGPVYLGTNVGIASNCTILPGVALLDNMIVHINSVVYKDRYSEGMRIWGDPAKSIGFRNKAMGLTSK